jgi:hypothetical protein
MLYSKFRNPVALPPGRAKLCTPGLGYVNAFLRSDLMLPHVTQFLATVNR